MKNILFICSTIIKSVHLVNYLLKDYYNIIGISSINDYYDIKLSLDSLSLFCFDKWYKLYFKIKVTF
jgi:hypothetical protein